MKIRVQRQWWRPWHWSTRTWLLALLACMVISPLATRWFCLWQVPDVSLPFEVEEFLGVEVPREQDALTYYASAARMLHQQVSPGGLIAAMDDARQHNGHWDERLDHWLTDNAKILAELEFGSNREHVSRSSFDLFANKVPQPGDLRYLMRVSEAEARRYERAGNLEKAWSWHKVTLRLANHTEQMGLLIDYLIASTIRDAALDSVRRWASHPALTAEQLRHARRELNQLISNQVPLSVYMKSEYLYLKAVLESAYGPDYLFPEWENSSLIEPLSSNVKRFYSWSIGQPELSLRFLRQILINNVNQIDQPLHLRRQIVRYHYPILIDLDPKQKTLAGQLNAIQLENALEGPLGRRLITIGLFFRLGKGGDDSYDLDQIYRIHVAYATMMGVVLAVQEFYRLHGEFPENTAQLVPLFLESEPFDPMSATGAPLHYLRDSLGSAKVWTIGFDGIDNGGNIEGEGATDRGYRIDLMDAAEPQKEKNKDCVD